MSSRFEEKIALLVPHTLSQSEAKFAVKKKGGGQQIEFSIGDLPIFELFAAGHSIRETTLILSQRNIPLKFKRIHRVLDELYLNGFLKNENDFTRHLDGLRWHYSWPEALLKGNLAKVQICQNYSSQTWISSLLGGLMSLALIFVVLSQMSVAWISPIEVGNLFVYKGSFWRFLLWMFVTGSLYFSFKTLLRGSLSYFSGVGFPALFLRVNGLGVYLDGFSVGDRLSLGSQVALITSILASSLSLFLLPLGLHWSWLPPDFFSSLFVLIFFWLLLELSPFSRSDLTRILMVFYNLSWFPNSEDSRDEKGFLNEGLRNNCVYFFHVMAIIVWIVAAGGFAVWTIPFLVEAVKEVIQSKELFNSLSAILMVLWWSYALGSLLVEMTQTFEYVGPNRSMRRYWRLKKPQRPFFEWSNQQPLKNEDLLKKTTFFAKLDERALKVAAANSQVIHYRQGDIVCEQGARDRDMYLLLSGEVSIYRRRAWRRVEKVADLGPGSLFGEVSFFTGAKRTADVVAISSADILRIWHISREKMGISDAQFLFIQDRIWLMQTLVSSPLFKGLPLDVLDVLLNHGQIVDVAAGRAIVTEGEVGRTFYILIQGRCSVHRGKQFIREMGRGDVFGEIALLFNSVRTASVVATEECKLLQITGHEFWRALADHLSLAILLEQMATQRVAEDHALQS
jgi:CRP-like cAMP-binding protein